MKELSLVQRTDFILDQCRGRSVLHLGCTNWPYTQEAIDNGMLLHHLIESSAAELYGLDYDQEGLDVLKASGSTHLYRADLEDLATVPLDKKFDVILAGEMIEHLNNPGLFLDGVKRFMGPGSKLVITTINAYCAMRGFWYGVRGRGGRAEMVHPDHVAYYSYSTLRLLVERHRMQVDNFLFYDIGKEHRPHNRWFLNLINDLSVSIAPQWADGIIAVCSLKTEA